MFKVSIYGKGGVGKSTVSANLSYLLSLRGHRVLHVGCDPKHDSTRLLTGGVPQRTFLDCMSERDGEPIVTGSAGVSCLECGGAEPGTGCAGKGMTAMFSYIGSNTPPDTDVMVSDVLGDVVCGGFGVPMRRSNTDAVILVVSEDFMSLYAANNILKGVRNLNGTACVLGMVVSSRSPESAERVKVFSEATGAPVISVVERSTLFSDAEAAGRTVCELFPDSGPAAELDAVADAVEAVMAGAGRTVEARPLDDEAMTDIAAMRPAEHRPAPIGRKAPCFDTVDSSRGIVYRKRQAMPACTSHGAVHLLSGVHDAAVVVHGPRNCAWLMSYAFDRDRCMSSRPDSELAPDNIYSTCMDAGSAVSGGREELRRTLERVARDGFRTAFVMSTCTVEMIGADMEKECSDISVDGLEIIPIRPDERFLSSRFGAREGAMEALASLIPEDVPVEKDTVCLLGVGDRLEDDPISLRFLEDLMSAYGLRIGARLPERCSLADLGSIRSSELVIVPSRGPYAAMLSGILAHGRETIGAEPLRGIRGVREWCSMLSDATGRDGGGFLERCVEEYRAGLASVGGSLRGKRILMYHADGIVPAEVADACRDLGAEIAAVATWPAAVVNTTPRPDHCPDVPRIPDVTACRLAEVVRETGADLLVAGHPSVASAGIPSVSFQSEHLGHMASISWARRAAHAMMIKPEPAWRAHHEG